MNSQEAIGFLVGKGEPADYSAAIVMDALCDGQAYLLKWHVIYDPDEGFTVNLR